MKRILTLIFIYTSINCFSQTAVITPISPQVFCTGTAVFLSSSNSIPGSFPMTGSDWSISGPTGFTFSATTLPGENVEFQATETGFYDVILINRYLDGSSSQVQNLNFMEAKKPVADFYVYLPQNTMDPPGFFICPPVYVTFYDASQPEGEIVNRAWVLQTDPNNPGMINSTEQNTTGLYQYSGTYHVSLVVQDIYGCLDTIIKTDFLKIVGGASGDPEIIQNQDICGQDFTFELNSGTAVVSWIWDLGDGTIINSGDEPDNNFMHHFDGVQTYYPVITLFDAFQCPVSYRDSMTVAPNGITAFFEAGPDEGIVSGTVVSMVDYSETVGNMLYWYWYFGDGFTDTMFLSQSFSHQYFTNLPLDLSLMVVDDRGCSDNYLLKLNDSLIQVNNSIYFYPNPTSDFLNLIPNSYQLTTLEVINSQGRVVLNIPVSPGDTQFDVRSLQTGMYFLKLINGQQEIIQLFEKL